MKNLFLAAALVFALTSGVFAQSIANATGQITANSNNSVSIISTLTQYGGEQAPKAGSLGTVAITTGPILTGSIEGGNGGVFDSTYSTVVVTSTPSTVGEWTPNAVLFTGLFYGPINWTLLSQLGPYAYYQMTGNVVGTLANGDIATGTATQNGYFLGGGSSFIMEQGTLVLKP
jgi:hypothetical protein